MATEIDRRSAMKLVGLAGLSSALSGQDVDARAGSVATPEPGRTQEAAGAATHERPAYTFFTPAEVAFIEAAVARLIPADDLGPGAREAGCTYFIDQQLAGAFGSAARWYMQGPFGDASPEQGYQLPLEPRQLYRLGIEQVNVHCTSTHHKVFDQLDAAAQDELLRGLEQGQLPIGGLPQQAFFAMLLANTIEGFFADPIHGGNRDKVGWTLVGFPGVAAAYVAEVANYNVPYRVEPVSIADIVRGQADLDEHGHPIHRAAHAAQP